MDQRLSPNDIISEFRKCYNSLLYFVKTYVTIPIFGTSDFIKLVPYDCQHPFFDALFDIWEKKEKTGIVFLASRQCGKTQLAEALLVWLILFRSNYPVVFMSRDLGQGKKTMEEIIDMIGRLPEWMQPKFKKRNTENIVLSNGSQISLQASVKSRTGSKNSDKGRGLRAMFLWIDEAAFVPLSDHMASMMPSVSRTFVVAKQKNIPHGILITSTPQGQTGVGKGFFDLWTQAYTTPDASAYYAVKVHWSQIPGYDQKWFAQRCAEINNDVRRINQEYELVFLGDSDSIFDDNTIKKLTDDSSSMKPIQITTEQHGKVSWWSIPDAALRYIIGIDIATEDGKDYSVIEVFNADSMEQVCEAVFKCPTLTFLDVYIPKVINNFKNKLIVPERNSVGVTIVEKLKQLYPDDVIVDIFESGFETLSDKFKDRPLELLNHAKRGIFQNQITRPLLIEQLYVNFKENDQLFKSRDLRIQSSTLHKTKTSKIEGTPNDDLCFAAGLAFLAKYKWNEVIKYHFQNQTQKFIETGLQDQLDSFNCLGTTGDITRDLPDFGNKSDMLDYMNYKKYKYQNKSEMDSIFSSVR